ncbi:50S ribosomal protein L15 [Capsulimonas corticalis]|uniref:Large ribosomal subunit protein uL15 n=1 Tax=Capsulimonas corticalis TaxID=2219043 RepID=A0A402CYI7_9BACT|nr:50S ribosomal protein L15 [Capsulimonas corticalis]BDI31329.1 50S ribosomal protein L15 [Capsulimonas corticalis]
MNLTDLKPNEGSTHRRKRLGRGPGSGHGKTSGGGHKGDKARGNTKPGFEGGQTPTHRRLPHRRGFTALFKKEFAIVNLSALERFDNGVTVTPELLLETRVINDVKDGVKILGNGELTKKLTVQAHHFSKSAQDKIASLGGSTETI